MEFDKEVFATRLRVKRAELDISQGELAERSGISLATICQYESGTFVPGVDKLVKLSAALGCSPNYLSGWPENS